MNKLDVILNSYFCEKSIGVWRDETYLASAYQDGDAIRLDFFRHDLKDGITWDEVQRIKAACGYGEWDAMELFPSDDAVINTGNIRHIFIYKRLSQVKRC